MNKCFNRYVMTFLSLLAIVALSFSFLYQPQTSFSARCMKVFDCKHIIIWIDNKGFNNRMKIKLHGVQCPERTTIKGKQARAFVKKTIYGKMIDIEIVKRRFWGWSDAIIYCNGLCLNRTVQSKWKH